MKRKISCAFFLSIFLTVSGGFAQNTVSLTGTVTSGGQPLQGVVVSLLAAGLSATTNANGVYTLSGQGVGVNTGLSWNTADNIRIRNNRVVIRSGEPTAVSIKLFATQGRLVSTVYTGRINRGENSIPFSLNRLGRSTYVLNITTERGVFAYKVVPIANGYGISRNQSFAEEQPGFLGKTAAADWLQATKQCYTSHLEQITSYTGTKDFTMATSSAVPDFGPNTHIFDPSSANIASQISSIYSSMQGAQFTNNRHAILFKPGKYNLSVMVGYYTEVAGLGLHPDSVEITGAVQSDATLSGGNATCTFWRTFSNLAVTPTGGTNKWAASQASPVRRVHIKGNLNLTEGGSTTWASGGFLGDSKVDGAVNPFTQQQWLSRNCEWGSWGNNMSSWNLVFVGCTKLPTNGTWPAQPYTFVNKTPVIAEKPFLVYNNCGYSVFVPDLKTDSTIGTSWSTGNQVGKMLPIDLFYVAKSASDNATTLNAALAQGKNLLLTPGVYHLNQTVQVTRPNTVVLGLGIASLVPDNGQVAMKVADVDGVKIGGVMFEANQTNSPTLLQVGDSGTTVNHSKNPTCLYDIYTRSGGTFNGQSTCYVTINSNDVIFDHNWLWRADHGTGAGWNSNKTATGLIVNGNNVTCYGLLVEHTQQYQTIWNGNGGRTYMYQSEFPYDPTDQASWQHNGVNGYASYKVSDKVTTHECQGIGCYLVLNNSSVNCFTAIETPKGAGIKFTHCLTLWLRGGSITHVINDQGAALTAFGAQRVNTYP